MRSSQSYFDVIREKIFGRLARRSGEPSFFIENLESRQMLSGSPVSLGEIEAIRGQVASLPFSLEAIESPLFTADFNDGAVEQVAGVLATAPLDSNQSFVFAEDGQIQVTLSQASEPVEEVAASDLQYTPGFDPVTGSVITAFSGFDPQDPDDSFDILTGWKAAVDELASIGTEEVTFAVYRQVRNGNLEGGPALATVEAAIEYANQNEMSVTVLPLFEVFTSGDSWRGEYDPTGAEQTRFRSQYTEFVTDLAGIADIDRFNVGTELNAMVNNITNATFFEDLIDSTRLALDNAGNTSTRLGYSANFDAFDNTQHELFWNNSEIDFLGVSAYFSVIHPADAELVSGTDEVAEPVVQLMVERWTNELDRLEAVADVHDLPVLIQEFGAVQENYTSVYPFAVYPGNFLPDDTPNSYQADAGEQKAVYQSLLRALDGRGETFESVNFWSWEHGADRGERTYENIDPSETRYINRFAIWPGDGGGGDAYTEFLATQGDGTDGPNQPEVPDAPVGPVDLSIEFDLYTTRNWGDAGEVLTVLVNGESVLSQAFASSDADDSNSLGFAGGDSVHRVSIDVAEVEYGIEVTILGQDTTSSANFGIDNLSISSVQPLGDLTSTIGNVTELATGNFEWSLDTADFPIGSQTVEIVADEEAVVATFGLEVAQALPPQIDLETILVSVSAGDSASVTFGVSDADSNSIPNLSVTDGRNQPIGTVIPQSDGTFLWSLANVSLANAGSITITAVDELGGSTTESFDLRVNTVPVVQPIEGQGVLLRGTTQTFVGTATDADGDELTTRFEVFRNGQLVDSANASTIDFTPAASGTYRIILTASDGVHSVSTESTIRVQSAILTVAGDVEIQGTEGRDRIIINPGRPSAPVGTVRVIVNGERFEFAPTGRIIAFGNGGNDLIRVSGSSRLQIDAVLDGGDGNDVLAGGRGNDILLGGAGNDRLNGSFGNDQLFGQQGRDRLTGGNGNDLLDGGLDNDADILNAGSGADQIVSNAEDRLIGLSRDDELIDLLI